MNQKGFRGCPTPQAGADEGLALIGALSIAGKGPHRPGEPDVDYGTGVPGGVGVGIAIST